MSRRFILLALLLLSVCWTNTCEAQLFRRGTARRSNQANYAQQQYAQQQYAQQAARANCNNGQAAADSRTQPSLYRLPNGRYAVLRGGRYYYAQPPEIQANNRQQQMRRNAYAEQAYGQQADQAARIQSANKRPNPAVQRSTAAAPTPIRSNLPTRAAVPLNQPPASASIVTDVGPDIEGPAIVGPVEANDAVLTLPPASQSVIQQVDGTLPVGTTPPAANIPTTDGIPVGDTGENLEDFSVLEKSGGDK